VGVAAWVNKLALPESFLYFLYFLTNLVYPLTICVCSVGVSVVQIRIWLYILAAIFINTHTCVSSSCGLYVPFSSSVCTADAIFNNISMTILFRPKKGRCIHKNIAPKRWNCINGLSFVKYWNWY